jgi:hypothetical protein
MLPPVMRPPISGNRPMTLIAVRDLPEPLSPTIPMVFPLPTSKLTPESGLHRAEGDAKITLTDEHAQAPRNRSRMSNARINSSPKRFTAMTVTATATPGKDDDPGAQEQLRRARLDIIAPQLGVGGCAPRPKKPSVASNTMPSPMASMPTTMTGAMALGIRCLVRIWEGFAPRLIVASDECFAFQPDNLRAGETRELR